MLSIYKYYREAIVDYRLRRLIKPRFCRLIPVKKLCPTFTDTSGNLEQCGVLLPAKLQLMADCGITTSHTDSSPSQKQQGKQPNTSDYTNRCFDAFLLCHLY